MIADILTFKGFRGWSCGDDYSSLAWDDAEAGRAKPSEAEIAAWQVEYDLAKAAQAQEQQADLEAKAYAKLDPVIQYLVSHTPAECAQAIRDFIDSASVTNLATAQACLGRIETRMAQFAKALSVLAREKLR